MFKNKFFTIILGLTIYTNAFADGGDHFKCYSSFQANPKAYISNGKVCVSDTCFDGNLVRDNGDKINSSDAVVFLDQKIATGCNQIADTERVIWLNADAFSIEGMLEIEGEPYLGDGMWSLNRIN